MKWALTTVTYRYHLQAFSSIVENARDCGFNAIELWEPHYIRHREEIEAQLRDEASLPIVVLSGYSDVTGSGQSTANWLEHLSEKMMICQRLRIPCLRLFTGNLSSGEAEESDWNRFIERVNAAQQLASRYDCEIVFETHPGTLLDTVESVNRFLSAVEHYGWDRIGLNFDIFHVWEFGADPLTCLQAWYPAVKHIHLKNARNRTMQFDFMNVYHPAGRYDELCTIQEGVYDIIPILHYLEVKRYSSALTLEWFGLPDNQFFEEELRYLKRHAVPESTKEIYV